MLPFALSAPVFPLRALAQLAGRSGLGGTRETLLGVLQAGRIVLGVLGPYPLPEALLRTRAAAARTWLAALAMPAPARQAIGNVFDSSALGNHQLLAEAWNELVQMASPLLDLNSRNELRRISAHFGSA